MAAKALKKETKKTRLTSGQIEFLLIDQDSTRSSDSRKRSNRIFLRDELFSIDLQLIPTEERFIPPLRPPLRLPLRLSLPLPLHPLRLTFYHFHPTESSECVCNLSEFQTHLQALDPLLWCK